jgi:aspartyl-tRNA(Asn)/glutamyl-tRNA(Gln) amidotransferase subunit B
MIKEEGLLQVSDMDELGSAVKSVITDNSNEFERYQNGEKQLFGFFMGATMKAMGGKSDPKLVKKILTEKLG